MSPSAQDYVALLQLFAEYVSALDEGDPDKVADCFADEGVWAGGKGVQARGKQEIRSMMERRKAELDALHPGRPIYEYRRHHVTSHSLEVENGVGTFRACFLGTLRRGNDFDTVVTGRYHGTVVKVGDQWRFQERHAILDSDSSGWSPPTEHM